MRVRANLAAIVVFTVIASLTAACNAGDDTQTSSDGDNSTSAAPKSGALDGVVDIDDGRGLYVRCTGTGSPTVVMEGGDGDDSSSYLFAEEPVAEVTRACVYDRANLGLSDPAPGPRGLKELVGDLEKLLKEAMIPGPYVMVGTSGGGFITAAYAVAHPSDMAGMVLVDTGAPFKNPPSAIVKETTWDHPSNIEQRDYLQVEKDAWAAREPIAEIPVSIVTVEFATADIKQSPFPSERLLMRDNVQRQQGWLVLSPSAEQIVVHTGHAVEEEDPELVIDVILDVVRAAR
jgi:pimeloyl-ACP methyl ester carboxylesterase